MSRLPRLALGTLCPEVDSRPISWGLASLLTSLGQQVQLFHCRSHFTHWNVAAALTGLELRYLDCWLNSVETCRELFAHGAANCDLAIVEGEFGAAATPTPLDRLAEALVLPKVAIVDVRRLNSCCLPQSAGIDAFLLDGLADPGDLHCWQTHFQSLLKVPVIGALVADPLRVEELSVLDPVKPIDKDMCRRWAELLQPLLRVDQLSAMADRQVFPGVPKRLFRPSSRPVAARVAVAYDECFHCYFPELFELLELAGATVVDFSPLREPQLPADVDLVYVGCGHPEQHGATLAGNHTMKASLHAHVRRGGRVYAEGSGMAYLAEALCDGRGELWPMVGLLALEARPNEAAGAPVPVEIELASPSWLGEAGQQLRGYRCDKWRFRADGRHGSQSVARGQELWASGPVVGSQAYLNHAAHPEFCERLLSPSQSHFSFASG